MVSVTYILKGLLGFNLDNREKRVVGGLKVLRRGDLPCVTHGKRTTESSSSNRREFSGLD